MSQNKRKAEDTLTFEPSKVLKPEDYPTYSPIPDAPPTNSVGPDDIKGWAWPPAITSRDPGGDLEWALKDIKMDKGKLKVRFPDWEATIVAFSENGVSSGRKSNKTYLRLQENKEPGEYSIKNFIAKAKVLMDQIIWLSRYEVVNYQKTIASSTGKSTPPLVIDPTIPCSNEYLDGNLYYSCFPNPEKTQAFTFSCRGVATESDTWTNIKELGVNRFLQVTGNSNFKVNLIINSAEFYYDKFVNAIKFTWWPQIQILTHFAWGQDVMYRPPKQDRAVVVNKDAEVSENREIAKMLTNVK